MERNFHKKSVFVQKIYEFPTKFVFIREYVDMNYHILRTFLPVFFYAFLLRFNIKTAEKQRFLLIFGGFLYSFVRI